MSTIVTINSTDLITNSRADLNTNFSNLNTDKIETSTLDTDTTLAANSDSKIATQKAVKAYVDAGGNVNASETTRGIVEEATDAEVTAGTATGATGAKLFITPAKLVSNLSTLLSSDVPAFQQTLGMVTSFSAQRASGSSSDGSVIYHYNESGAGGRLARFLRDSVSGAYYVTHATDPTITIPSGDSGSIIQIGIYIYFFSNNGTNIVCSRFLAADLTGETTMTVPTVGCTTVVTAWTDGIAAYVVSAASNTTSRKWSLSGTTFSASSTATVTAGLYTEPNTSTTFDGTSVYVYRYALNEEYLWRLTNIDGSTTTSTTLTLVYSMSDAFNGSVVASINSTKIYIGTSWTVYDEAAAVAEHIVLIPRAKP